MIALVLLVLTNYEAIAVIPTFANVAARPVAWVNRLIGAADTEIKNYCKKNLELESYTDFYDGEQQQNLVIRQTPVWLSNGFLDPSMNGVALPTGTITVLSTSGFHPGTAGNPNANPPAIAVLTAGNKWTSVTYTGTTPTTFTGCLGGTGNMATNPQAATVAPYSVSSPVVFLDPVGRGGQLATSFGASTQLAPGNMYMLLTDIQGKGSQTPFPLGARVSKRGLLRYEGGGSAFFPAWPSDMFGGKLAGLREPVWPRCHQGIKVVYNAGFLYVPADLEYACAMLVSQMVRIMPTGADVSSQSLGALSYSLLNSPNDPSMGEIQRVLNRYREDAWGVGS